MPRHLSLAALTVAGATPPEMISIAAETGYDGVTIFGGLATYDVGAKVCSLLEDPVLRRETGRRIAATGVNIDLVEGMSISPNLDMDKVAPTMDVMAALGARLIMTTIFDPERQRASDRLSMMCTLAKERGLSVVVEFMGLAAQVRTLQEAVASVATGQYPSLKILVDTLHLIRTGGSLDELAAIDPRLIGFVQISDGPLRSASQAAYFDEAVFERQIPGRGEFPLVDFLRLIPTGIIVSPEVPMRSRRQNGTDFAELAKLALYGARDICGQADRSAAVRADRLV